jgi:hypothetical protein
MPYTCGTGLVCGETFASFLRIADEEEENRSTDCDEDLTMDFTTILYSLIRWRRWDAALERLNQCPQEASVWIVTGTVAEQYQRDHGIMNPNALSSGYLPLHLVCMETTRQHRLIQELIRVYPEAVRAKDPMGRLPLHLFCLAITDNPNLFCSQNNVESVRNSLRLLLDYYPDAMYVQDQTKSTPLSIITNAVQRRGRTELTEVFIASVEALAFYHSKHPNPPTTIDFPPRTPFLIERQLDFNNVTPCGCSTNERGDIVKLLSHPSSDICDETYINCSTPLSPTSIILHFSSGEGSTTIEQPHQGDTNQLQLPCLIDYDDLEPQSFQVKLDNDKNEHRKDSSQHLECQIPLSLSTNVSLSCYDESIKNVDIVSVDTHNNIDHDKDRSLQPTETETTDGKSFNIEEGKRCSWDSFESTHNQEETDCDTDMSTNCEALDTKIQTLDELEPFIPQDKAKYLQSKIMELELAHRKINLKLQVLNQGNQSSTEQRDSIFTNNT